MKAVAKEERRLVYPLVLVFCLLAVGIVTVGYYYYRNYERQFRAEAESQLSAIAELKIDELAQYRKERLLDAGAFFKNDAFSVLVRRFLEHPEDAEAQPQIEGWTVKYMGTDQYDLICLFDAQGVIRMSVPAEPPISTFVLQNIPDILRSGQVTLQDFHRNERDQRVYMALLVPIYDVTDRSQALGVLALRIDPETYLYPFIQRWPTPSLTAETLLVRREGKEAVYLNELKFQTNTALNLRISLENTNVPAVKAVLRHAGVVEGTDYRGVPVLAALHEIPDSPWSLVAKMDRAEVYAPLHERLRLTILLVSLLLISAGAGIGAIWRHQRVRFYRVKYEAEADRAKLSAIVESSEDAIISESLDGTITSWNAGAERIYGYSAAEAVGKPITILIPPEHPNEFPQITEKIKRGEAVKYFETERIRKNGERIQMALTLSPVKDEAGAIVGISVIGRDITERKQADAVQARLVAIMEASPDFVGYADAKDGQILYINRSGRKMVGIGEHEDLSGVKIPDVHPEWVNRKLREEHLPAASREGFWSGESAFRHRDGREIPVWMVLQAHRSPGGGVEIFSTVSRDITERKQAEEELRDSRALYYSLVENMPQSVFRKDRAGHFQFVNERFCQGLRRSSKDIIGRTDADFFPPELAQAYRKDDLRVMEMGQVLDQEEKHMGADGRELFVHVIKTPLRDTTGKVIGIQGVFWDVTERKRAEEALHYEQALTATLMENLPDAVYFKDAASRFLRVNRAMSRKFGLSDPAQFVGKSDTDLFSGEHSRQALADEQEILRTGQPLLNVEEKETWLDGTVSWVLTTKLPLRGAAGRIIGTCGISRDITERKRAEEALQESQALYFSLAEQLPVGVFRKDREGRFVLVNPEFCRLKGMKAEEFLGKKPQEVAAVEVAKQGALGLATKYAAAGAEHHEQILQTGKLIELVEEYVHADGRKQFLHVMKFPVVGPDGKIIGSQGIQLDITERRLAEETIAHERQLLRTLIDLLPETFYIKDLDSRFLVANEALAKQWGKAYPSQLIGLSDTDLFPAEQAAQYRDEDRKVFAGEPLMGREGTCVFADGREHMVLTTKVPYRDSQGRICGLVGFGYDITERKRTEAALQEAGERFQLVTRATNDAVWDWNLTSPAWWNDTFYEVYGFDRNTPPSLEAWASHIHPDDQERVMAGFRAVVEHGETVWTDEFRFRRADGTYGHVFDRAYSLRNASGKTVRMIGSMIDITERKRAEQALKESEVRYQRISEAITDYIYTVRIVDGRTVETTHGPGCLAVTGYRMEEFADDPFLWLRMVAAEDRPKVEEQARRILAGEDSPPIEHRIIHKNGTVRWVRNTFVPHRDERGTLVAYDGLIQDITERKRAEIALQESLSFLQATLESTADGILAVDNAKKIMGYNQRFTQLWRLPREVLDTKDVDKAVDYVLDQLKDPAAFVARASQFASQPEADSLDELEFTDGRIYEWYSHPQTVEGRVVGRVSSFRDITERKRAEQDREQALRRQQGISRLHESLLESRPLRDKLQLVTETIVRLFDADFCRIWLTRPGDLCEQGCMHALVKKGPHVCRHRKMCLHLQASAGRYTHLDGAKHRRVPFGAYKIGLIAAGKEAKFLINNVQHNPRVHDRKWAKELGLVSFAGYRLQSPGGVPLGVLALFAKRPLTAREDLLLEDLSNATASVLLTHLAEDETRRELTERKRAEEALRASEERYRTIMEQAADAVFMHDETGRILDVNQKACQSLGYSREELLSKSIKDIDPEAIQTGKHEMWGKILAGEQFTFESHQMRKNGSVIPVEVTLGSVRLPLGPVVLGIARDITERKQAEDALRESEAELRSILESTADGILAVDRNGERVIKANRRYAEMWRIPQSIIDAGDNAALRNFVLNQLSDPDAFLKRVHSLYRTDTVAMDTLVFKDGRIFERHGFPMMLAGAVLGRVWSFRDITERKRQERELIEKSLELERFTYTVSHDLKSPLVTVKTFLGYLEQDLLSPDKERVQQDVGYMHTAADKMGHLLDELLNLARVGRKTNPPVQVTFQELAREVVGLVAGRISTSGTEVQVAEAAVVLEGDRSRLVEIWQNLVENACKFMGDQPKPRVEIGIEKRGAETVFFVRDNGVGIEPRFQEKVFSLFEKLNPKMEGTGMGLALVKRVVELYKGRIWVESDGPGQGANFLFTLPAAVKIGTETEQSS